MKLWKATQIQTFEMFGARKYDHRSCLMQFRFLGRTTVKLYNADIDATSCERFKLRWLDAAIAAKHPLPRYEALQEALKNEYKFLSREKDRIVLIIKRIIVMLYGK